MSQILSFVGFSSKEGRLLRREGIDASSITHFPKGEKTELSEKKSDVKASFNEMQQARIAISKTVKAQIQSTVFIEKKKRKIERGNGVGRTGVMNVRKVQNFIEQDGQQVTITKSEEKYMMNSLTQFLQTQNVSTWQGEGVKDVELDTGAESKVLIALQIDQVRSYLEAKGVWIKKTGFKQPEQSTQEIGVSSVVPASDAEPFDQGDAQGTIPVVVDVPVLDSGTSGQGATIHPFPSQPQSVPEKKLDQELLDLVRNTLQKDKNGFSLRDIPDDLLTEFAKSVDGKILKNSSKAEVLSEFASYIASHVKMFLELFLETNKFEVSSADYILSIYPEKDIQRALKAYFAPDGRNAGRAALSMFANEVKRQLGLLRVPESISTDIQVFAEQISKVDLGNGTRIPQDYIGHFFSLYKAESLRYLQMCRSLDTAWREAGRKGFISLIESAQQPFVNGRAASAAE